MNGTKIASKAKARLANFMGKVFGKLQYPKGQSILSKAQFHIKLGGAASPLPAKPTFPNPTPKPYKRQNQAIRKSHNCSIGLLLSRCAHEISSCRFSAGCSHGRAYEGFRAPSCRPSTTERCGLPPSPRWRNVFRILGTSLSDVRMRRAFGLE